MAQSPLFKTSPPYKVTNQGTQVHIGGVTVHVTDDEGKVNRAVSDAQVTRAAKWTIANIDPINKGNTVGRGGFGSMLAHQWVKGGHPSKLAVLGEYMGDVYEYSSGDILTPSPLEPGDPSIIPNQNDPGGLIPGITGTINAFSSVSDAVVGLINAIFDPHFWLRFLEGAAGLLLVGIGLAHLTNFGPQLRQVPLYGKMIPT